MPTKKEIIDGVKTAFVGGSIGFLMTVVIISVSIFAGAPWSASIGAFPVTVLLFAITVSIYDTDDRKKNFDQFLMLTVVLYFILALVVLIWWLVSTHTLGSKSWKYRTWAGFGTGISLWVIVVTVLLSLYYHNKKWYDYFQPSKTTDPINAVVEIDEQEISKRKKLISSTKNT